MGMVRIPTLASGGRANLHQGGIGVAMDLATGLTFRAVSRGESVLAYRLGNPSAQFEKYLNQGQIGRARKTLYRDAISVSMNA